MRLAGLAGGLLLAVPLAAQDDEDFAQGLARRGFTDLAEQVYEKIKSRGGRGADFGLLSVRVTALSGIREPEERISEARKVLGIIRDWLNANRNHPRRVEVFGLLSETHQLIGKTYVFLGDIAKADSAFRDAIGECGTLVRELEDKLKGSSGPEREKVSLHLMLAKYQYLAAVFYRLDALKDQEGQFETFEGEIGPLEKFFTDFMWDYENYLLAMDASTYMGRIYQVMAQMASATGASKKAKDYWIKCFRWIGKGKGPIREPKHRNDPDIQEVGLRAFYYEMVAKVEYGNLLRKQAGPYKAQYQGAIDLGKEALGLVPGARKSTWGTRILLEMAKAYMALRETDRAKAITSELLRRRDPRIRRLVNQVFGEYAGLLSTKDKFALAEEMFTRQSYYGAVKQYQEILAGLQPGSEYLPDCWYRIAQCYYETGRYFEAVLAYTEFLKHEASSDRAREAGVRKLRALRGLAKLTGDAAIRNETARWEKSMADRGWLGLEEVRRRAIEFERKEQFDQAIAEWEKVLKEGTPDQKAEALGRIGYNRYFAAWNLAQEDEEKARPLYEKALETFEEHLKFVRGMGKLKGSMVGDVSASYYYGTRIYVRVLKDFEGGLRFSSDMMEKIGQTAKPLHLMYVLELRMECLVNLLRIEEAEAEFFSLEKLYEEHQVGLTQYQNGLVMLTNGFDAAAKRVKDSDPKLYDKYFAKAVDYQKKVVEMGIGGEGQSDYDRLRAMAGTYYDSGMAAWTKGDRRTAARSFKEARGLYQQLVNNFQEEIRKEGQKTGIDLAYAMRYRIARCAFGEGDLDTANKVCDDLLKESKDLDVIELKADILRERAGKAQTAEEKERFFKDAARYYGEAAAKYKQLRGQSPKFEQAYFRNLYNWCAVLFEYSEGLRRLEAFFKQAELSGETADWDKAGEWGTKLRDIQRAVEAQSPKR